MPLLTDSFLERALVTKNDIGPVGIAVGEEPREF
jgi:hypothetical protein